MLPSSGPLSIKDIYFEVFASYPTSGSLNTKLSDLITYFPQLDQSSPIPISRFYGATVAVQYTLTWTYTKSGSGSGTFEILVDGSSVVSRTATDSGSLDIYNYQTFEVIVTSTVSTAHANLIVDSVDYSQADSLYAEADTGPLGVSANISVEASSSQFG